MTPLSQMQATKNLLTEAQRIAYVGLCKLATEEMVGELREVRQASAGGAGPKKMGVRSKGAELKSEAEESCTVWGLKIMARLYAHMELTRDGTLDPLSALRRRDEHGPDEPLAFSTA